MLGFEIKDILLLILVVLIGGKPVLNVLSLIPGFAPLAKVLEKLTTNGNGKIGELKTMITELQMHYNHDTTSALEEIKEAVGRHEQIREAIEAHDEKEMPILNEISKNIAILVDRSK